MVDSIKEVPIFHTITNTINMFVTGYWTHSWWEMGPYFKFYSHNPIEGHRFRFGGRTSNQFSTDIMFNAHIAYGTRDQKFKYGGGFMYMVNKNPRRVIENSINTTTSNLDSRSMLFRKTISFQTFWHVAKTTICCLFRNFITTTNTNIFKAFQTLWAENTASYTHRRWYRLETKCCKPIWKT